MCVEFIHSRRVIIDLLMIYEICRGWLAGRQSGHGMGQASERARKAFLPPTPLITFGTYVFFILF